MNIIDLAAATAAQREEAARCVLDAFAATTPAWPDIDSARLEVEEALEAGRVAVAAIDEDGRLLGWVGSIPAYDHNAWELHPLAVHPEAWGRGVGRALVEALERRLGERGEATIFLGTDDEDGRTSLSEEDLFPDVLGRLAAIENRGGHPYEFYQRMGYVLIGALPDANGPGKPDIFMAKRVGPNREDLSDADRAALEVARALATALDLEEYDAARALLADDCEYTIGDRHFDDPDAIVASYRESAEWAAATFDGVDYEHRLGEVTADGVVINYIDRLRREGKSLVHASQQIVRVDERGLVTRIVHRDLPGEQERVARFFDELGIRREATEEIDNEAESARRLEIARRLVDELRAEMGERLLGAACYASVAHRAASRFSDIEMLLVTDEAIPKRDVMRFAEGVQVLLGYVPLSEVREGAARVGWDWGIDADGYRTHEVIWDPSGIFPELAALSHAIPDERFEAASRELWWMIHEARNKVRNALVERDPPRALVEGWNYAYEVALQLALRDRRPYESGRTVWRDGAERSPALETLIEILTKGDVAALARAVDEVWQEIEAIGVPDSYERSR